MSTVPSRHQVRITVLRRQFNKDLIDKYAPNPDGWKPCDRFAENQQFVVPARTPWDMPEGFCGWAWADMQKMVWAIARGGPRTFVTSCTDEFRPVLFLLEQLPAA